MSSNTYINNKWKSDPCKRAEKAARLGKKRVAKRNQAEEEKMLTADDNVLPTEEVARDAAKNTLFQRRC